MARRVHRRGRFGRKASATLRSLYPIVLGLGGWFLGVLIVLTTMPGVPLDDALLAALSVGVPIGLGIYFAWVNRDWSADDQGSRASRRRSEARSSARGWGSTRPKGCSPSSPRSSERPSVRTWSCIVLDIAWERRVRDRVAETTVKETLEARPSAG